MVIHSSSFSLKYAPHFGMFEHSAGSDLLDQLQFISDNGFVAFEDVFLANRKVKVQEKIATKMNTLGMEMGAFIGYANFKSSECVSGKKNEQDHVIQTIKESVEIAKRVRAKWMMLIPGTHAPNLPYEYQTANLIELLKRCVDVVEPHGVIIVIEPLNWYTDHPNVFLTKVAQAYQIVKAVNSPYCKIVNDLYHQQITEGNLLSNMTLAWDEIVYIQIGDNPGRNEPTTGEINYKTIFKFLHERNFKGIIGMEHGNSIPGKEGELAVIKAYMEVDNF